MAALDRRQRLFERKSRRRAQQSVAHHIKTLARIALGLPLGHVRRKDRRGVINGRVDSAVMGVRMTSEMRQQCVLAIFAGSIVILHEVGSAFPGPLGLMVFCPACNPGCWRRVSSGEAKGGAL